MVKILNVEMAKHYLTQNEGRKLYSCNLNGEEVSLGDLNEINREDYNSFLYQFYTENLGGVKWHKYSELDLWDVTKSYDGTPSSWSTTEEFLTQGYVRVINVKNKDNVKLINELQACTNKVLSKTKQYVEANHTIENIIHIVNNECPNEIVTKLLHEYEKEEFHPDSMPAYYKVGTIQERIINVIFENNPLIVKSSVHNGWQACWIGGQP